MFADASRGVTLLRSVHATAVVTAGARVAGVHTTAGHVRARAVVLAAGIGSTALARTVGVHLPLRTRAVSYCVFRPRTPHGHVPTVVDSTTGAWLRPWGTRDAVLAGVSARRYDVPAVVVDGVGAAESQRVRAVVRQRCPALADADVIGGVTAYDAMAPDTHGSVTVCDEPGGLVTATGWNGAGFKVAPAVGRRVAEQVQNLIGVGVAGG
jgi:glycine/D-amino acid oxidase-like deaminating enzyme